MAVKNNNGTSSPKQLFVSSCLIFFIVVAGSVGKIDAEWSCTTGTVNVGYCNQFAGSYACTAYCGLNHYSIPHSACLDMDCYYMVCPPGGAASKMIATEKLKLKRSCTIEEIIDGVCFP